MDNPGNTDRYNDYPDELPVIVRRSELINLMVMDRGTMQEVGRVERLWMYPQAHRILGLICKGGGLLSKQRWAYKLPQIESLNQGNIWIEGTGGNPTIEQVRQLQTLIDHEVWVDGGDRLGVIVDCLFNRKTGQITQYLFVNNRLRQLIDDASPLRPEEILSFGNQRVLVSPKAVARLRRERPNLKQTFNQMKDQAKAEYEQVTNQTQERVRNWGEEAKTAKERLAEQAARLKEQATERAKALQEQASQEILPQISEQAQELSQRVGEQYHNVQRRAQDFVEDLPPLEQLSEEMQRYGRDRYPQNRSPQDYDRSYGQGYGSDQGYAAGYAEPFRGDWNSSNPAYENRSGAESDAYPDNYPGNYESPSDSNSRPSHRSRYRRDERLEDRPYYDDSYRNPPDQGSYRELHDPDELTWVDETEDLSPSSRSPHDPEQSDSTNSYQEPPRRQRYRDSEGSLPRNRYDDAPPPSEPAHNPPTAAAPAPEKPASRDNPWGYTDSATESDWDDMAFATPQSPEPTANPPEQPSPEPLPNVAPEDLEDDDPWI